MGKGTHDSGVTLALSGALQLTSTEGAGIGRNTQAFAETFSMSPEHMHQFSSQYGDPAAALRAERAKAEWSQARFADRKSAEDIGHQIIELAGHLNAAHYRFLMLIAEWDHRKGWGDGATQSCAHWLNWKCGIDMGAAREKCAPPTHY